MSENTAHTDPLASGRQPIRLTNLNELESSNAEGKTYLVADKVYFQTTTKKTEPTNEELVITIAERVTLIFAVISEFPLCDMQESM